MSGSLLLGPDYWDRLKQSRTADMLGFCVLILQVTSLNHQASRPVALSTHVAIPVAKGIT